MDPVESVKRGMKSCERENGGRKRFTPFQEDRKCAHISRSLWNSLLRRIREPGLDKPRVKVIMRQRKGRPGAMTLQAKCRELMSDWRSRRRQQVLVCQAATSEHSLLNLSSGSLASMVEESRSIPMNSNCVEGRKVFPGARGMFRSVKR